MNYFSCLSLSFFSHQFILLFCVFISIFVFLVFIFIFLESSNTVFLSNFLLEYFWTLFPLFIVLLLFLPLFFFSYNSDLIYDCYFITANQWFWDTYNFESFSSLNTDFAFNAINSISISSFVNFFLTSNDVLHAFSLPTLFLMVDLVPGVLHNLVFFFPLSGVYIVYCAQICGMHHSAMALYLIN